MDYELDKTLDEIQEEFNVKNLRAYICTEDEVLWWIECYKKECLDEIHSILYKYKIKIKKQYKQFDYVIIELNI